MTEDTVRIPLFPLPLVVVPGEAIPLHIFEDRYKQLISDIEPLGALGVFGISLVRPDGLASVGCGVRVERFIQRYEDGKLDVLIRGAMRYEIRTVYEEKPYLEGRVAPLEDLPGSNEPSPLRDQAISLHARYSELMTGRPVVQHETEKVPLSFVLASVSKMKGENKQQLLEARSEHQRLELLIAHYQVAISEIEPSAEITRVTRSNGVLKH